ncbi:MAG: hypothetical protein IJI22_01660 [Bacilli bacterium]|nr:hypothetical protein [Bacilli bacterium]
MIDEAKLNKINNELKVYMNESGFISNKCRNKVIKILSEEFNINFKIDNYANVDVSVQSDGKFLYRGDLYQSADNISSYDEFIERYKRFTERADKLLSKREIDFENLSNFKNISNLIVVLCLLLFAVAVVILGIHAFLVGNYFDCLWLVVFIIPAVFPRLKSSLEVRITQAKNYLKRLMKKVK